MDRSPIPMADFERWLKEAPSSQLQELLSDVAWCLVGWCAPDGTDWLQPDNPSPFALKSAINTIVDEYQPESDD